MSPNSTQWWTDDLTEVCVRFQIDLSCLLDDELDDAAAARAIAHLEECSVCSGFFADARQQVKAHRQLADPDALVASYSTLLGSSVEKEIETIELVSKLSTIFYQLGKSYVLTAVKPGFLKVKMFEDVVQVGGFQTHGRGFVDGVIESGRGTTGGIDWANARHMLNGKLEKIEAPIEKGRRLLREALAVDPMHEESRFYLAWADKFEGKTLRAATGFRQLFRTAVNPVNRAHAAVQLGKLHADQGDHRRAIACYRWVAISGMATEDKRFSCIHFNVGVNYANLGDQQRSLESFRRLIDSNAGRLTEVVELFAHSEPTQAVIASQEGFAEALYQTCPELFGPVDSTSLDEGGQQ
jgi:tetratricopeptide (TPR) repeat protein